MKNLSHLGCGLVALITGSLPGLVWSAESVPSGYRIVASERAIPDAIFYAVALAESGRVLKTDGIFRPWPWTLNVAGDGYYYPTRIEAWQALRDWLDQGKRSIDIGLMQVNWRYHQERLGTPWQVYPCRVRVTVRKCAKRPAWMRETGSTAAVRCANPSIDPGCQRVRASCAQPCVLGTASHHPPHVFRFVEPDVGMTGWWPVFKTQNKG